MQASTLKKILDTNEEGPNRIFIPPWFLVRDGSKLENLEIEIRSKSKLDNFAKTKLKKKFKVRLSIRHYVNANQIIKSIYYIKILIFHKYMQKPGTANASTAADLLHQRLIALTTETVFTTSLWLG